MTRGPMRIEARGSVLRISGDVYVSTPVIGPVASERDPRLPLGTLIIRRNAHQTWLSSINSRR